MTVTGRSDLVEIADEIRDDTREKAILFYDGARTVWLPRSQIEINGDSTVTMPEWLADDKGLI